MARRVHSPEQLSDESKALYEALNGASPLACALIAGAFVEKALTSLLSKSFVKCETASGILGNNGFLGEFSRCADMAYCLGLISKGMLANVKTIGMIRNRFAHSHQLIDFDDQEVRDHCRKLVMPVFVASAKSGDGPGFLAIAEQSTRARFMIVTSLTFNAIVAHAIGAKHRERYKDAWPNPPRLASVGE